MLLLLLVAFAPLPAPKVQTLPPGTYELTWSGTRYVAAFHAGGRYEVWSEGGHRWAGDWKCEKGELVVRESGAQEGWPEFPFACRWSMKLPAGADGTINTRPAPITMRRLK